MATPEPKLTLAEKAAIVRLELRGLRRAAAGITEQPDIDRQIARIKEKARLRAQGQK
ncbi:hypothetical protein STXM2123_1789 [Streptomyces sp. F-3]|uniref:DUF6257 family protein n=1 Tax=Streptomyces sp. F-3 TaxID=1840095 RepID=UPI0007C3B1B1|nr:DUF6257 family protein [Streptomyces sp. F-3]GAT81087.1 hypothetical protein STXM2123_1789 [Streptomyces sp. F-3]